MTDPTEKTLKPSDEYRRLCREIGETLAMHAVLLAYLDEQHAVGLVYTEQASYKRIASVAPPEPAPGSRVDFHADMTPGQLRERFTLNQLRDTIAEPPAPVAAPDDAVACSGCEQPIGYCAENCPVRPREHEPPAPEAADGLGLLHDRVHVDMPGVRAAISHREPPAPEADASVPRHPSDVLALASLRKERDAALSQVEELAQRLDLCSEAHATMVANWSSEQRSHRNTMRALAAATSRAEAAEARAAKLEAELTKLIAQQACRENGPGGDAQERPIVVGSVWRFHLTEHTVTEFRAGSSYPILFGQWSCSVEYVRENFVWVSDPPAPQEPGSEKP